MPLDPNVDYEHLPPGNSWDETDVNLRHYICELSDEVLAEYDSSWTDEQVIEWSDNFTNEGNFFLVCSEREVDVKEFREVLEVHLQHRTLGV